MPHRIIIWPSFSKRPQPFRNPKSLGSGNASNVLHQICKRYPLAHRVWWYFGLLKAFCFKMPVQKVQKKQSERRWKEFGWVPGLTRPNLAFGNHSDNELNERDESITRKSNLIELMTILMTSEDVWVGFLQQLLLSSAADGTWAIMSCLEIWALPLSQVGKHDKYCACREVRGSTFEYIWHIRGAFETCCKSPTCAYFLRKELRGKPFSPNLKTCKTLKDLSVALNWAWQIRSGPSNKWSRNTYA